MKGIINQIQLEEVLLQRTAGPYIGISSVGFGLCEECPVYPPQAAQKKTFADFASVP
jgi:hypothetical protein